MSVIKEKYIGESDIVSVPKKKIGIILNDNIISTSKIQDGAVTPEKLSSRVSSELVNNYVDPLIQNLQNKVDNLQSQIIDIRRNGVPGGGGGGGSSQEEPFFDG